MPAILDEPANPPIFRPQFGAQQNAPLPLDVYPRQVTLRDRITVATVLPFSSEHQVPYSLRAYLSDQMNKEIEMGDTYPMLNPMSVDQFSAYWFQNFGAVMMLGSVESPEDVVEEQNWATLCLGSFYIRPNYPGRASHVCGAGFLVTDAARNKGVGRLMGETYLEWAPRLGYTYSVFNLVFETNVVSCRIWDALGFKRIGRVKGAGDLKSYPGQLIDAIIYGRDLGPEEQDLVSEERFDKIKFYLKYGTYPTGADRAEKSRLRSAATHYKLLDNDKLMLKDKEVISDPQRQYEIAKSVHVSQHAGINKTTAIIALKYHWVRIKETVSQVIKNCSECKELGKVPPVRTDGINPRRTVTSTNNMASQPSMEHAVSNTARTLSIATSLHQYQNHIVDAPGSTSVSPQVLNRTLPSASHPHSHHYIQSHPFAPHPTRSTILAPMTHPQSHPHHHHSNNHNDYMPLDPQMMISEEPSLRQHFDAFSHSNHARHNGSHDHDERILQSPSTHHHERSHEHEHEHEHGPEHDDADDDSFQAMLGEGARRDSTTGLDMLIDEDDDESMSRTPSVSAGDQGSGSGNGISLGGRKSGSGVDVGTHNESNGLRSSDVHMDDTGLGSEEERRKRQVEEAARRAVEEMRIRGHH